MFQKCGVTENDGEHIAVFSARSYAELFAEALADLRTTRHAEAGRLLLVEYDRTGASRVITAYPYPREA